MDEIGRNVTGIEHMLNFRLGLRAKDDTLPTRWFDEENTFGPFKGEKIDRTQFEQMKTRFYALTGLNTEGLPQLDWHEKLAKVTTGFSLRVELPNDVPGAPEHAMVIDEPVSNVVELRQMLRRRLPEAAGTLGDRNLNVAVNGEMVLSGEKDSPLKSGDRVTVFPMIAGG